MKTFEYKTVTGGADTDKFDKEVTALLNKGWELHGSPFMYSMLSTNTTSVVCQAMTKTTDVKPTGVHIG